jgi:hypothetical protein
MNMKMTMDVEKDMVTWTRTYKYGRRYGNMDKDIET